MKRYLAQIAAPILHALLVIMMLVCFPIMMLIYNAYEWARISAGYGDERSAS